MQFVLYKLKFGWPSEDAFIYSLALSAFRTERYCFCSNFTSSSFLIVNCEKKLLHLGPWNFACPLAWCGLRLCRSLDQNGSLGVEPSTPLLELQDTEKFIEKKIADLGHWLETLGEILDSKVCCLRPLLAKIKIWQLLDLHRSGPGFG